MHEMTRARRSVKIAALQTAVYADKRENLAQMQRLLALPQVQAADLVTFGEMFTTPYVTENFPVYAEPEGGESWQFMSRMAREHHIYLSAGTVPERDEAGRIYNTAYVFDREGRQIARHRKTHLFDIAVRGGQCFRESDTMSGGEEITVFDTEFGRMGLCICFDLRFPEMTRLMALRGAKVILVPAAFNMTTGPLHWELLFRQRAVDDQVYMLGTAPARDESAAYVSYGHTILVHPWGTVLRQLDGEAGILLAELDLSEVDRVREELPLLCARRTDVYTLCENQLRSSAQGTGDMAMWHAHEK